ncbi:hypothetical protein T484DRAFT_1851698 [Baffinella frigidus]|nr:hypothetical protein T484DRAFT_1851698 [Cryptophyta sp. CCMP2293]
MASLSVFDRCPGCDGEVTDESVRAGWRVDENDYTTECAACSHRFVAHFVVQTLLMSLSATQVDGLPDKTLGEGGDGPSGGAGSFAAYLRKRQPAIFWNIAWHFLLCKIPPWLILSEDGVPTSRCHTAPDLPQLTFCDLKGLVFAADPAVADTERR